ncbi:hypothetical protein EDC04DRAFT_2710654 [Pisolithus marmoratus]|nr:hypothetical protein EDC04DRAFT_2710654 [Pisolithus marmoratus]
MGVIGLLSYYRTTQLIRFAGDLVVSLPSALRPTVPVVFIGRSDDETCSQGSIETQRSLLDKITMITLEDKGHWLILEAPEAITNENLFLLKGLGILPGGQAVPLLPVPYIAASTSVNQSTHFAVHQTPT